MNPKLVLGLSSQPWTVEVTPNEPQLPSTRLADVTTVVLGWLLHLRVDVLQAELTRLTHVAVALGAL